MVWQFLKQRVITTLKMLQSSILKEFKKILLPAMIEKIFQNSQLLVTLFPAKNKITTLCFSCHLIRQ